MGNLWADKTEKSRVRCNLGMAGVRGSKDVVREGFSASAGSAFLEGAGGGISGRLALVGHWPSGCHSSAIPRGESTPPPPPILMTVSGLPLMVSILEPTSVASGWNIPLAGYCSCAPRVRGLGQVHRMHVD